jgi:hypothetical protein
MDNVTFIRVVAGILAVIVFVTLIFRMKKSSAVGAWTQKWTHVKPGWQPFLRLASHFAVAVSRTFLSPKFSVVSLED